MENKKKLTKLAYIVTEKGCMVPETGAFNHITSGIRELSKHFDLITLLPDKVEEINSSKLNNFSKKLIGIKNQVFGGMLEIQEIL